MVKGLFDDLILFHALFKANHVGIVPLFFNNCGAVVPLHLPWRGKFKRSFASLKLSVSRGKGYEDRLPNSLHEQPCYYGSLLRCRISSNFLLGTWRMPWLSV